MWQVSGHDDRLVIELQDHITNLQAALGSRTTFLDLCHQRTRRFFQPERLSQVLVHFLDDHAQPAATDLATTFQLVGHVHGHIDRNRERHAHETARTGVDLGVDAHHLTGQIKQRTARVTRVDRHVGLDERNVVFVRQAAADRTDDTLGHGVVEAEWRANGYDPLTGLQVLGLAELEHRQVLAVDFQQRHVGARIGTDQLGLELAAIGQAHQNLVGIGNHMVIGQDVAVGRNDETRAQGLGFTLATTARRTRLLRHSALEELAQHGRQPFQIRHLLLRDAAIRQLLSGTDVHHRRRGVFDQLGEVRQAVRHGGNGLAEHQHGGKDGKTGFQAWYRHTAPVTTSRVKRYGARNTGGKTRRYRRSGKTGKDRAERL